MQRMTHRHTRELDVFYKIIGKIGFLKTIEGERGIRRLSARLRNHMTISSDRFIE